MLAERRIPLDLLPTLKGTHCRVMTALFRYADKDGVCWPGLRTLAKAIDISIRTLRRALDEMAAMQYLAITKKKGSVNRYRLAARFLRASGRPVPRPVAVETNVPIPPPDDNGQLAFDFSGLCHLRAQTVSPVRTEGVAKESQKFIKIDDLSLGRSAPPTLPAEPPTPTPTPSWSPYSDAVKRDKRMNWLGSLNAWVTEQFAGDEATLYEAWALIAKATDRSQVTKAEHAALNRLDNMMRGKIPAPRRLSAVSAANEMTEEEVRTDLLDYKNPPIDEGYLQMIAEIERRYTPEQVEAFRDAERRCDPRVFEMGAALRDEIGAPVYEWAARAVA
jgi:hypothetical protein